MNKLAQQQRQALEKCRLELFGRSEPHQISSSQRDITRDDLAQAPLISIPRIVFIHVPKEVWSDEVLKAKVAQGMTLKELKSFLHSQIHSQFVRAFQGHSEGDYSPMKDKMWPGTRTTGNPTEKKSGENFAGGQ